MHAIELSGPAIDALAWVEHPEPGEPRRGEVLLRMRAAGLNFLDVAVATGLYPGVQYPVIPLADGAGAVPSVIGAVAGVAGVPGAAPGRAAGSFIVLRVYRRAPGHRPVGPEPPPATRRGLPAPAIRSAARHSRSAACP